jgi:hypothetical protein
VDIVVQTLILALGKLRQEDGKFEDTLGYIAENLSQKIKIEKPDRRQRE